MMRMMLAKMRTTIVTMMMVIKNMIKTIRMTMMMMMTIVGRAARKILSPQNWGIYTFIARAEWNLKCGFQLEISISFFSINIRGADLFMGTATSSSWRHLMRIVESTWEFLEMQNMQKYDSHQLILRSVAILSLNTDKLRKSNNENLFQNSLIGISVKAMLSAEENKTNS